MVTGTRTKTKIIAQGLGFVLGMCVMVSSTSPIEVSIRLCEGGRFY